MKLLRYGPSGQEKPGILDADGRIRDLSAHVPDLSGDVLSDASLARLRAIDPATGKIAWEYKNKAPLWGGVLATAGNLVFTGTPEGFLKAFDAKSGKELWKFNTGSGVVGSPVTWEQDGEQYVAVMSGWGGAVPLWGGEVAKAVSNINQGGALWVFKLPRS